jgi:hypothetical protein
MDATPPGREAGQSPSDARDTPFNKEPTAPKKPTPPHLHMGAEPDSGPTLPPIPLGVEQARFRAEIDRMQAGFQTRQEQARDELQRLSKILTWEGTKEGLGRLLVRCGRRLEEGGRPKPTRGGDPASHETAEERALRRRLLPFYVVAGVLAALVLVQGVALLALRGNRTQQEPPRPSESQQAAREPVQKEPEPAAVLPSELPSRANPFAPIELGRGRPAQPPAPIPGAQPLSEPPPRRASPEQLLPEDLPSPLSALPADQSKTARPERVEPKAPEVKLHGTMGLGPEMVAIVEHRGNTLLLRVGDLLPGQPWQVADLQADRIELQHTGEKDRRLAAVLEGP